MHNARKYDEDNLLSMVLFLYFSFLHGALGIYLITLDISQYNYKIFNIMTSLMSMDLWGMLFCTASVFFIITALQENKPKYISMVAGGVIGSLLFGLTAIANTELPSNLANTLNYAIISSLDLVFAFVGGMTLWKQRT